AKVLALEGAPHGIRSNIINPDAVFQDSKLWSEEIRRERAAAQGIDVDQIEDFYRKRNLLGVRILPDDVAQAALFFASDRSAKTTGCTLTVGGENPKEFELCGVPHRERGARVTEGIDVVRTLWRDSPASFKGRFTAFDGVSIDPKPVQRPGPPIWIGGRSDAALTRAGRQ